MDEQQVHIGDTFHFKDCNAEWEIVSGSEGEGWLSVWIVPPQGQCCELVGKFVSVSIGQSTIRFVPGFLEVGLHDGFISRADEFVAWVRQTRKEAGIND